MAETDRQTRSERGFVPHGLFTNPDQWEGAVIGEGDESPRIMLGHCVMPGGRRPTDVIGILIPSSFFFSLFFFWALGTGVLEKKKKKNRVVMRPPSRPIKFDKGSDSSCGSSGALLER